MIDEKQKIQKLKIAVGKIETQNTRSELLKNQILGYLDNWLDSLPDEAVPYNIGFGSNCGQCGEQYCKCPERRPKINKMSFP